MKFTQQTHNFTNNLSGFLYVLKTLTLYLMLNLTVPEANGCLREYQIKELGEAIS